VSGSYFKTTFAATLCMTTLRVEVPMDALVPTVIVIVALITFELAAIRFGADSRDR